MMYPAYAEYDEPTAMMLCAVRTNDKMSKQKPCVIFHAGFLLLFSIIFMPAQQVHHLFRRNNLIAQHIIAAGSSF